MYKAERGPKNFPGWSSPTLPGIPRNFEIFKPLDFLAQVTQHIPNRSQHLIRYYGWYSNKARGLRKKTHVVERLTEVDPDQDAAFRKAARRQWAALIKKIYEIDPLVCTKCGGKMEIIAFITEGKTIRKILDHIGMTRPAERAPPREPQPSAPPSWSEWTYAPEPHVC